MTYSILPNLANFKIKIFTYIWSGDFIRPNFIYFLFRATMSQNLLQTVNFLLKVVKKITLGNLSQISFSRINTFHLQSRRNFYKRQLLKHYLLVWKLALLKQEKKHGIFKETSAFIFGDCNLRFGRWKSGKWGARLQVFSRWISG